MADFVPDEMYVLLYHDGQVGRFPDFEEIEWVKLDEDYFIGDEPGPRFQYGRQGQRGVSLPIPTDEAWQKFLARLDEIGVFSWETVKGPDAGKRKDYEPPVWTLEIHRPGMKAFEREGPIDKLPPGFDKFCEALSELMGGQAFGRERRG